MTVLEVLELGFSYGGRKVLDGVNLSADSNSILSILGPNGVGKTTLLRCICGLHRQSEGSVLVDGREIGEYSPRELARLIAYVPQKANATHTTIFDAVLMGRRPHIGWSVTDEDMEVAWECLESLGLSDMSLDYIDEISGGEFQKVQVARAMAQEPKLLILDEPSNNLDIANQHITMSMLDKVARERGLCTVMTMHDINLAAFYSDRFLFMKGGKVAAFGGRETITSDTIGDVYGMDVDILDHGGMPVVVPRRRP